MEDWELVDVFWVGVTFVAFFVIVFAVLWGAVFVLTWNTKRKHRKRHRRHFL